MVIQINNRRRLRKTSIFYLSVILSLHAVPWTSAQDSIVLRAYLPSEYKEHLFVPAGDGAGLAMIAPEAPIDIAIIGGSGQTEPSIRPKTSGYVTEVWKLEDAGRLLPKGSSP